jgi:hypothetical protein
MGGYICTARKIAFVGYTVRLKGKVRLYSDSSMRQSIYT